MNKERVGRTLRSKRKELGQTLQSAADEIGASHTTLSYMEKGFSNVGEEKYIAYAEFLGVSEELFGIVSEAEQREQELKARFQEIEYIVAVNPNKALTYLDELVTNMNLDEHPFAEAMTIYLKARCYYAQKKWEQAQEHFFSAIRLTEGMEELEESNITSVCYNYLGIIAYVNHQFSLAVEQTQKGIDAINPHGKRLEHYYNLLLNKAIYLEKMDLNEKALQAIKELHKQIFEMNSIENLQDVRNSVIIQMYLSYGTILNNLGLHEEALEFLKIAIPLAYVNNQNDHLFTAFTTVGIVYYSLGNLDQAEVYYRLALDIEDRVKSRNLLAFTYANLSSLLIQQNLLPQAENYMKKSLKVSQQDNNQLRETEALMVMANWYRKQGMFVESMNYLKKADRLADQHRFLSEQSDIVTDICSCCLETGDQENFKIYTEKLYRIQKTLKS